MRWLFLSVAPSGVWGSNRRCHDAKNGNPNGTIRFGFVQQEQIWRGRNTARMLLVEPITTE
jgi:hypothetical protein